MEILKARIDWRERYTSGSSLYLLLKDKPKWEDFRFDKKEGYYFAENQGLVKYYYYLKPGDGFGGRRFPITMQDGIERVLKGPWSSRASVMNKMGFHPCIEAAITEEEDVWKRGHTFFASAVTIEIAKEALKLMPGIEFRKHKGDNGEINYRIREIGKTLEQSKEKAKERKKL
ncbi:hypothetical protein LCGC14_1636470 [marine sediment metagenome]|uniref:Uncharacterized protein n=1 Tax=marine sediment metagenome TaxID=412755 RepID=A0A0F9INC2_9ZZZZ